MIHIHALLLLAALAPHGARRVRDVSGREELLGVSSFHELAAQMGSAGEVAGQLVTNLEEGVAGTVTGSAVVPTEVEGQLRLEVTHSRPNRGEIATPSKVPAIWALDLKTTYTLEPAGPGFEGGEALKLSVTGVELLPFREGREWYEASGVAETCAGKGSLQETVTCERRALFKWFEGKWSTFRTKAYLREKGHKLARILNNVYGSYATYMAVKAVAPDAWQNIVYQVVTLPNTQIDYFVLTPDVSDKANSVDVVLVTHEASSGPAAGLDFKAKQAAFSDPQKFEKQRGSAERVSPSAINFAAMNEAAHPPMHSVRGGTAEKILRITEACDPKGNMDKYDDPTDACRGSGMGRVFWHSDAAEL